MKAVFSDGRTVEIIHYEVTKLTRGKPLKRADFGLDPTGLNLYFADGSFEWAKLGTVRIEH